MHRHIAPIVMHTDRNDEHRCRQIGHADERHSGHALVTRPEIDVHRDQPEV